jgi:hypothetical protein
MDIFLLQKLSAHAAVSYNTGAQSDPDAVATGDFNDEPVS